MTTAITSSVSRTILEHIIELCNFPDDSTMVEYIQQQGWTTLTDVTMVSLEEVNDFKTVKEDGSYKAKPLTIHLRRFKGFLLYYNRKCRDLSTPLDEEDVFDITRTEFTAYCGSPDYQSDLQQGLVMTPPKPTIAPSTDALSAQEFRRGVKRDKSHYTDLKDDKHFNSWNRGFVATAYMHHTQHVLDEHYIPDPTNPTELALFTEMQVFMYAVLEEHLKTDTGKSLVSQYEETRDAQSIYRELKRHAKSSTAAQLSSDTLLKYITSARYPGTWRGTSYAFVLHWKEQVAHYEKLELEAIPPKQKLRMLQNTVGDVSDLANVKQLSDQVVARGGRALDFEGYIELLLSACSTYDKNHATGSKSGQRNVYSTHIEAPDDAYRYATDLRAYHVDIDVSEILAHATDTQN